MASSSQSKSVLAIEQAPPRHWVGNGFPVSSMFSYDSAPSLDPFLLLDYAAPAEFRPALAPRGVGGHPHRGFETVTLAYRARSTTATPPATRAGSAPATSSG